MLGVGEGVGDSWNIETEVLLSHEEAPVIKHKTEGPGGNWTGSRHRTQHLGMLHFLESEG